LPCGGRIELLIVPRPDPGLVNRIRAELEARRGVELAIGESRLKPVSEATQSDTMISYRPRLRLRIAGRGADPVALARLARASGLPTALWSPEADCLDAAGRIPGVEVCPLETPRAPPPAHDDDASAFILMFHDLDWEPPLLVQALAGPAFYIGAVGSRAAHATRCDRLRERGLPDRDIERIHGPVGLVPSMRDASMLAISTLAEIVAAYSGQPAVMAG